LIVAKHVSNHRRFPAGPRPPAVSVIPGSTTESLAATQKAVYLVGGDPQTNRAVRNRLARHRIAVRAFRAVDHLLASALPTGELVVVLDMQTLTEGEDPACLLRRLEARMGRGPDLICVVPCHDLGLRLQALRAGALAVRVAPVSPDDLASWLTESSGVGPLDPYRVLVVDDQPVAATFAARVLESAGMRARALAYPLLTLDVMEEFRPDLVLMDMHMPAVSGMELTGIIREHDDFFRVPVVFLSRELHPALQLEALRRGGDDFLTKPVDPSRLVALVQRRIQIARLRDNRRGTGAGRDPATGLYGRPAFLKQLTRALGDGATQGSSSGVLHIELDAPRAVIERIGPACRPTLIRQLGGLIEDCLAPEDTAARIGDCAFGVLARRVRRRDLNDLAQRLRVAIAGQTQVGGPGVTTVSIGVGLFRPRADDALTMLSRAQKAMDRARSEGGDRVATYEPLVPAAADGRDDALAELVRTSLRCGGLELLYQPIVAMRERPGERYEASLRLRAPDGEYIPPFDFLPVAEDRGLMPRIDRWVMETVLDRLRLEAGDRGRELRFHVQQTMQGADAGWVPWLRGQIESRDLIRMRPVVQFDFQDVTRHLDLAAERFVELGRLGIKICLSRFPGGHAGLKLIERIPVAMVKLSTELVQSGDAEALTGIVAGIHRRRAGVIAAGIDGPRSIAHLWGCGVDFLQGSFLQLPSEDLDFDFSETALG
jgi:diguanylate cyclase (GGDEF)-like protein